MPVMKGFRLEGYRNSAKLWFGQFSNDTKEYRGESFTILWGDGTSSLVEFDLYPMPAAGDENPSYYQATRLDGTVNSTVSLSVTVTAGRDGVGSGTVSVKRR